jgi:acyl carrier protein
MIAADFVEPLREYVARHHLDGRADLTPDAPLLEWGVIDSFALPDLVQFIEDRFAIQVPLAEITPESFATLTDIGALLARLQPERG